jgi:DNA-binding transcriptional ArsR family regulator
MASAELLVHPVRLRIIKAFLEDRALTTSEVVDELGDVPSGSVYRHVSLLAKAGVLRVVAERRVRGSVERTYTLRLSNAPIRPDQMAAMNAEDHVQAFMAYVTGLLADFDRSLAAGPPEPVHADAVYHTTALWLTDAELVQFSQELSAVVQRWMADPPGNGRRRRLLYTVLLTARHPVRQT